MIAHLNGLLLRKRPQTVIIEAGGIGYEVQVPLSTFYSLPDEDMKVGLHIYTHVREDALLLFGFQTQLEKDIFIMLTSVSGIGPKLALNILSGIGPEELLEAIATGDAIRLQSIPGVGKKTSERIALELRERASKKLGAERISPPSILKETDKHLVDDALSALVNLGYSARLARRAVLKVQSNAQEITLENLIREALKILA